MSDVGRGFHNRGVQRTSLDAASLPAAVLCCCDVAYRAFNFISEPNFVIAADARAGTAPAAVGAAFDLIAEADDPAGAALAAIEPAFDLIAAARLAPLAIKPDLLSELPLFGA